MSALYEELVERIRGEALDLESVVQRARGTWIDQGVYEEVLCLVGE